MDSRTFRSFARTAMELQSDFDTPPDYTMIKAAVEAKYGLLGRSKIAMMASDAAPRQIPSRGRRFMDAAKAEVGPASGAVVGAGIANAYGVNPLAGAAAGYGIGAIPEIIHGIRHRV